MDQESLHLLENCSSGADMAIASIDDVLDDVQDDTLRDHLIRSKELHESLREEAELALRRVGHVPPEASPMARRMAKMKTGFKLTLSPTDSTVAELMTDGCNMGIQSLSRYLNQHPAADVRSRDLARRLIGLEDHLAGGLRPYL